MGDGTADGRAPAGRVPAARVLGTPASTGLYQSLVDDAFQCVMTVRNDLTVGYVNPSCFDFLGWTPLELEGKPCVDFVHPDDLDRALLGLVGWNTWGMPGGSSSFRLLHKDGSWRMLDMSVSGAVAPDDDTLCAVSWRPAGSQHAVQAVLSSLLEGCPRAEAIEPLLQVFDWSMNDTHVAIAWHEPGRGHQFVTTGLPVELTGADDDPDSPWGRARATGVAVKGVVEDLDPRRRAIADEHDRQSFWIEPVVDTGSPLPGVVTVFTRVGGPPTEGHAQGMETARTNVALVLQWSHQVEVLDLAANTDALTGLPNRRSLFDLLDRDRRGGALLFCDLDRFKPVNDELGHHVGDEVLRQVAERLRACVRDDDVVARTGGDEFVVLARGASTDVADELVERITEAIEAPFPVPGGQVELGISIGTARSESPLTDAVLARADKAMLADKARRHHPTRSRAHARA
jgi:diguanylate cyclase (GGDEF)-like protein/PAS domain S-box-containing protein